MKLYVTGTSPYARIARIAVIEKGLSDRVEVIAARTRQAGSPYYAVNVSGRVPYLVCDDGSDMEDSELIAAYFDQLDGAPRLRPSPSADDWAYGRLEARARSFTDGVSVWVREMRRPPAERSPTVLAHEVERARRLAAHWNDTVAHPHMSGPPNMAQLLLIAGLDFAANEGMGDFEMVNPRLAGFAARMRALPSVVATRPGAV